MKKQSLLNGARRMGPQEMKQLKGGGPSDLPCSYTQCGGVVGVQCCIGTCVYPPGSTLGRCKLV